jgi:dTDP-4-amino-4,6-dideoxygalactose transaminase
MKKIQLFVPTFHVDECLEEIKECLEIGWTGLGFKTLKFEEAWKEYTGLPYAHYVNSATAGLYLAVRIFKHYLNWQDGDEIISTPLTFISTNHAILHERLKPVFADIDDTLCLDPVSVERLITPKTKAVMFVGMGGNAGRLDEVARICKKHNLILILDAAHMSGTKYNGKHVGTEADATIFSYHAVKNLPTADSGMICFREEKYDKAAREWSWLGINKDTYARFNQNNKEGYSWYYEVENEGLKAHGNSVIASIALIELKYLEAGNERRRNISSIYQEVLSSDPNIRLIKYFDNCVPSRHLFQIRVAADLRDKLIEYLNTKDIYPGVHYRANTEYKLYRSAYGTCPEAEKASNQVISLPLHLKLTDEDVLYVADNVLHFFQEQK